MKKSRLIDMFGLSGGTADDDRLDDLLFRLESSTSTSPGGISGGSAFVPFSITISTSGFESEDGVLHSTIPPRKVSNQGSPHLLRVSKQGAIHITRRESW